MSYLKLHRDEPDQEPPAPLPFESPNRTWRQAGDQSGDSIKRAEQALTDVESKFTDLRRQADAMSDPIQMSDWLDDDDDGPRAA